MDLKTKRKLNETLRTIIGSGFKGTQEKLGERLSSHGFHVTQSTISRALKTLGAVKTSGPEGTTYRLQTAVPFQNPDEGHLSGLVTSLRHNGQMIVLKTRPGSATFVAGYIDHHFSNDILGTVAGDDTVFVAPQLPSHIRATCHKIQEFLRAH